MENKEENINEKYVDISNFESLFELDVEGVFDYPKDVIIKILPELLKKFNVKDVINYIDMEEYINMLDEDSIEIFIDEMLKGGYSLEEMKENGLFKLPKEKIVEILPYFEPQEIINYIEVIDEKIAIKLIKLIDNRTISEGEKH